MKYKSLGEQFDRRIKMWKLKKNVSKYSASEENYQKKKQVSSSSIHIDVSITLSKNAAGVTVASKRDIKEASYTDFQKSLKHKKLNQS